MAFNVGSIAKAKLAGKKKPSRATVKGKALKGLGALSRAKAGGKKAPTKKTPIPAWQSPKKASGGSAGVNRPAPMAGGTGLRLPAKFAPAKKKFGSLGAGGSITSRPVTAADSVVHRGGSLGSRGKGLMAAARKPAGTNRLSANKPTVSTRKPAGGRMAGLKSMGRKKATPKRGGVFRGYK